MLWPVRGMELRGSQGGKGGVHHASICVMVFSNGIHATLIIYAPIGSLLPIMLVFNVQYLWAHGSVGWHLWCNKWQLCFTGDICESDCVYEISNFETFLRLVIFENSSLMLLERSGQWVHEHSRAREANARDQVYT